MEDMRSCTLDSLKVGEACMIEKVSNSDDMKRRLYDLGFVPGETVKCVIKSPLGDPKAFLVKNTVIALRCDDSSKISVITRH